VIEETLESLAATHGLVLTSGRMIFELRPPIRLDKGTAVTRLARERGLKVALYLGDDRTDIDAFLAIRRMREQSERLGFAVAVNHHEAPAELRTAADVVLPAIDEVPRFLRWLLDRVA
jgi:trehalose 6-phosphate phosphatase